MKHSHRRGKTNPWVRGDFSIMTLFFILIIGIFSPLLSHETEVRLGVLANKPEKVQEIANTHVP